MVVIGVLFGTAEAFFRPAYTGLVPQTVPEADIQGAQALTGVSRELAQVVSPALATALVLGVGGAAAFALDAATFAVSAVLLSRVRARQRGERAVPDDGARRAPRGLRGAARAHLGVGGHRRVLRCRCSRAGAVLRAGRGGVGAALRHRRGLRARQRGLGRRHRRRRAGRVAVAAALPDARGDARARCPGPAASRVFALGAAAAPGLRLHGGRRARHRRCSRCGGRQRWRSASRRTCCRASPPGTGWARSPCCRWATCCRGPSPTLFGGPEVLVGGGLLGVAGRWRWPCCRARCATCRGWSTRPSTGRPRHRCLSPSGPRVSARPDPSGGAGGPQGGSPSRGDRIPTTTGGRPPPCRGAQCRLPRATACDPCGPG